ncbi:MAG: ArsC family reductase [Mariprofundaceae bacterium]|nr:ArsC family reductase [Mariprofundaceae bacterium]
MTIHMYGIPNCDTIKKARRWLKAKNIPYTFHDYKKEGISLEVLQTWCEHVGWEALLNKRGTTWRKLSDADQSNLNQAKAMALLKAHTSMIKRPVLAFDGTIILGFSESVYDDLFQ